MGGLRWACQVAPTPIGYPEVLSWRKRDPGPVQPPSPQDRATADGNSLPRPRLVPLGRRGRGRDTPVARWARELVARTGLLTDAFGNATELQGEELTRLQRRLNDAFISPVQRVTLREPLLLFRFYGDLCLPVTRLYTSLITVVQVPGFGWATKELLGLTGRNGADHLAAVRVAPGSQIVAGGISNRATWADQVFVEIDRGLLVVDCLSQDDLHA